MQDPNLASFIDSTIPLTRFCPAARVSAVLTMREQGWMVLIGQVTTLAELPTGEKNLFRRFGQMAGISAIVDRGYFGRLFEGLHDGQLRLPEGPEVYLATLDRGPPELIGGGLAGTHWRQRLYESRRWAESKFGIDWPLYYTSTSGWSIRDMLPHDSIEASVAELPMGSPPFAGLNHLLARLGIHEDGTDLVRMTSYIHLMVPVWTRLLPAHHSSREHKFRVSVEAVGEFSKAAFVSVMPGGTLEGTVVPLTAFERSPRDASIWAKEFDFPLHEEPVRIALSVDRKGVDSTAIASPDERLALHLLYDPGLESIGQQLGVEVRQTNAVHFEEGVTSLLHLLGFSSSRYGHKLYGESPDALALCDGRPFMLVVECTTGAPGTHKWSSLRHRANEVVQAMRMRGLPCYVAPVLFTQTDADVLSDSDVGAAKAEGVAILSRDDLASLLEVRRQGEGLGYFRSYFHSACHPTDPHSTINSA